MFMYTPGDHTSVILFLLCSIRHLFNLNVIIHNCIYLYTVTGIIIIIVNIMLAVALLTAAYGLSRLKSTLISQWKSAPLHSFMISHLFNSYN